MDLQCYKTTALNQGCHRTWKSWKAWNFEIFFKGPERPGFLQTLPKGLEKALLTINYNLVWTSWFGSGWKFGMRCYCILVFLHCILAMTKETFKVSEFHCFLLNLSICAKFYLEISLKNLVKALILV